MGFYLRKSFRAGPIRFNLSKSGIGISAGVTGARVGMTPTGRAYVHGGRGGLYFRKSLGGGSGRGSSTPAEDVLDEALERGGSGVAGSAFPAEAGRREAIELTAETGATYGVSEQREEPDETETPARPESTSGPIALCLVVAFLLAAFLGFVPWTIALVGSVASGLGVGILDIAKRKVGDGYGRLLDERLGASDSITDDAQAEIEAARAGRWLVAADTGYFEQRAYSALVESGVATGWRDPADLERLHRAEQVLSLDPEFVRRMKLDAYRRAHVEATADHDLTEAEEAALERARTAFGLAASDLAEELSLVGRLRELRAIRAGALPRVKTGTKLRSGEVCHLQSEGRLLKKRILRSFSRNRQKYKVRGFVVDKAGTLLVTSKRILLVHQGTTSITLDKIVDLEVDEDRQLLTLTRDGRVTPSYLTTPDALRAGAIVAALAEC